MKNIIPKVLLIDDEPIYIRLYRTILRSKGYEVYEASGYKQAAEVLNLFDIDVIILDYDIPEYNGIQILEKLKSNPLTKDIPVIMSTGLYSLDLINESYENGASSYMEKPVNSKELTGVVEFFTKW